jgi:hypothetical protein
VAGGVSGDQPRATVAAFDDLERAVRHLGEELAFFRRRALDAERRLRELTGHTPAMPMPAVPSPGAGAPGSAAVAAPAELRQRVAALEAENDDLRDRLAVAAERTRALADRVRFVRQQQQLGEEEA